MTINLIYTDPIFRNEVQVIAAAWSQALGVRVLVEFTAPAVVLPRLGGLEGDPAVATFDASLVHPTDALDLERDAQWFIPGSFRHGLGGFIDNQFVTDSARAVLVETDNNIRAALWAQVLAVLDAEAVRMYTVRAASTTALGTNVQGYTQGPGVVIFQDGGLLTASLAG